MGILGEARTQGKLETHRGVRTDIVQGWEHLDEELARLRQELLDEGHAVGAACILPLGPIQIGNQPLVTDANGRPRVSMGFLVTVLAR